MSTIPGIATSVTSELTDYAALGGHIAEASNEDQANFLAGLAVGFQEFGDGSSRLLGLMQLASVREAVDAHNEQAAIRWFVGELHAYLSDGERP